MLDGAMFLPDGGDDQLLLAVDDRVEAVVVDGADVAGVDPAVLVDQGAGGALLLVVAGGVDRAAAEDLAVLGEAHLDAGVGPPDGAELEGAGAVGGEGAGRLGHAVDVEDLQPEAAHELRDLQRHRRRGARGPPHLVEAEQQPEEAEDRLVGLRVGLLDLGRHLVAVLVGLRPGEPGGHRVGDELLVGGVRVLGELGRDAGLDLLPDPRDAEEGRGVHLAERAEQPGRVGDRVHVVAEEGRAVRRQHPLGDVGEREVADRALLVVQPGRRRAWTPPRTSRCGG